MVGAVLVGSSIYLSLRQTNPAATSAQCEECGASRYVIRQLPPPDEGEAAAAEAGPTFTPTILSENLPPQQTRPTATAQPQNSATATPEILALGDAVAPPVEARQQDEVETHLITATPTSSADSPVSAQRAQDVLTASLAISDDDEAEMEEVDPVEETVDYVAPYTSTDQVNPPPNQEEPAAEPQQETVAALQPISSGCPAVSGTGFEVIPMEGQPLKDHPGAVHGDLNLVLRGYIPIQEKLDLVDYEGNTDGDPPQLAGLFEPNRIPRISSVYQVNDWIWLSGQCGGHPRGCPGPPAATFWPVTLAGLATTPGEAIYTPERGAQLYSGGYVAMVLFAEKQRITLGYTRRDSVATGYVVHIEDICVDPNLVGLYQAQLDGAGWNETGRLPALRNNQALGTALSTEIKVAIRDAGSFMDPRSRKDWWR
jgi:hypothetical protein